MARVSDLRLHMLQLYRRSSHGVFTRERSSSSASSHLHHSSSLPLSRSSLYKKFHHLRSVNVRGPPVVNQLLCFSSTTSTTSFHQSDEIRLAVSLYTTVLATMVARNLPKFRPCPSFNRVYSKCLCNRPSPVANLTYFNLSPIRRPQLWALCDATLNHSSCLPS